ncbi:MAG: DUF3467 domain-containing protein [Rouxiella badensis]|uniref:DUF3467 domain-containing protein n=1 Tax=Rouxiella badensis TaxID=1646377 RepID=UPI003C578C1A
MSPAPSLGRLPERPVLPFSAVIATRLHFVRMNNPQQPNVKLSNDATYRESYANSVQMRVNIWDFFLVFGTLQQQTETNVEIRNFQGIYLSPQQAKALLGLLQQNIAGYESAFGEIKLDPRMAPQGPVH